MATMPPEQYELDALARHAEPSRIPVGAFDRERSRRGCSGGVLWRSDLIHRRFGCRGNGRCNSLLFELYSGFGRNSQRPHLRRYPFPDGMCRWGRDRRRRRQLCDAKCSAAYPRPENRPPQRLIGFTSFGAGLTISPAPNRRVVLRQALTKERVQVRRRLGSLPFRRALNPAVRIPQAWRPGAGNSVPCARS